MKRNLKLYACFFSGHRCLTFTQNNEDYDYVHGTLDIMMNIDVVGLSETNSPWNNHHVTDGFNSAICKYSPLNKTELL
jgi:hypothetical protein